MKFPGSKWWKFEFHAHTPASDDYPKDDPSQRDKITPKQWLQPYIDKQFDAVVVTDHNSGEWVDKLKQATEELRTASPTASIPVIFPGVELGVDGGYHILLVLDPSKGTSDIAGLVRACGYDGKWGDPAGRTTQGLSTILDVAQKHHALVIPAHVNDRNGNGIWNHPDFGSLLKALRHRDLFAWEELPQGIDQPPAVEQLLREKAMTVIAGSDCHTLKLADVGCRWTWVKMSEPSRDGLRLALLDAKVAIRVGEDHEQNPNDCRSDDRIEEISVERAQFMGREIDGAARPFTLSLSPWMTTVIGGRGTGKSTLLEFSRIVLGREDELPDDIRSDFDKRYNAVWAGRLEGGLQTPETVLRLVYRKGEHRYRISYSRSDGSRLIEEQDGSGSWQTTEGTVQSRFPLRIYSQKQVFQMASDPAALLREIDAAPEVGKADYQSRWDTALQQFHAVCARIRELQNDVKEEERLKGELQDVTRRLQTLEKSAHEAILKRYQRTRSQLRYLELWSKDLATLPASVRDLAQEVTMPEFDEARFQETEEQAVFDAVTKLKKGLSKVSAALESQASTLDELVKEWHSFMANSDWAKACGVAETEYKELTEAMREQGGIDPSEYDSRVKQKNALEGQLQRLVDIKKEIAEKQKERATLESKLAAIRKDLSERRQHFLSNVLQGQDQIQMDLVPHGDHNHARDTFRALLGRQDDSKYDEDILSVDAQSGLLADLYIEPYKPVDDFEAKREALRDTIGKVHASQSGESFPDIRGWFANNIRKLRDTDIDDLAVWFPEDTLRVKIRTRDRGSMTPIEQGSPGQRTAALLLFFLSHGSEPMLLDQPEDDLDNRLIYDVLTAQLTECKTRRQLVIVTHNANVVVNGDAELVVALSSEGGQTQAICGGLQEEDVRRRICSIMEGGERAFDLRYRRIREELRNDK